MMDFSNLKFDKSLLFDLQSLNPQEILGKLGLSPDDTNEILQGNFSPAEKADPFIIDFHVFCNSYKKLLNANLISYFFNQAQQKIPLTYEEQNIYGEAYNFFFDLVFNKGSDGIFPANDELCLLFKYNNYYFLLTQSKNIIYLEKTSISLGA